MASQEERNNFFSLTLLLFRVGNQKFREYFKAQWPIVYQRVRPGTVPPPWQDTPRDATEMKNIQPRRMTFRFRDEETKFNSGNINNWDFSLLTTVLRYSSLNFVLPSSPESDALDDLKAIRNKLTGHPTDAAIPNAVFNAAWRDACNALKLFNATAADFKSVQDDVKKPLDVLYPMLLQCVAQEKEIQRTGDTIINKLEQFQQTVQQRHTILQQTVEQRHTILQQTVEQRHTILQQTVEQQHATLLQTVEKQYEAVGRIGRQVDLLLDPGQQGQKRSSAETHTDERPFRSDTTDDGPSQQSVAVLVAIAGFILYGFTPHYGPGALVISAVIGALLIYVIYWAYTIYCERPLRSDIADPGPSQQSVPVADLQSIDAVTAAAKVSEKMDKYSMKNPPDDVVKKCRYFCALIKEKGRTDIVKEIRKKLPSGITGPLTNENVLVEGMIGKLEDLTRDLCGNDKWKQMAEHLSTLRPHFGFYGRKKNPAKSILEDVCRKRKLTVGDLYDVLCKIDANALADEFL